MPSADHLRVATVAELRARAADENTYFETVVLVRRVQEKTARNGNTFLTVELGDRTGSFHCVVFGDSPAHAVLSRLREGAAVRVSGQLDTYQDRLSPRLTQVAEIPAEELARSSMLDRLVETPPEDLGKLAEELVSLVARIGHAGLRATTEHVFAELGDRFRTAPAAVSMHHAYRGGLLEHTVHVARAASALLPLYPEVDHDLALAGALLHDVGKVIEYTGDLGTTRTRTGILQGHVVLGYRLVRAAGIKAKLDPLLLERLEHVVLSHQGQLEWGAAAMAATPEAVFVSMVDNLDAKLGMVQRAIRQGPATPDGFTEFHPGLEAPLYVPTPPKA